MKTAFINIFFAALSSLAWAQGAPITVTPTPTSSATAILTLAPTATIPAIPGRDELKKAFDVQKTSGDEAARAWFEKARDKGNLEAGFQLALLDKYLFVGQGIRANDLVVISERAPMNGQKAALKYLLELTIPSAEQGNLTAETRLYNFYSRDPSYTGYPQDKAKAGQWLLRAAQQGDPSSQYTLASGYEAPEEGLFELDHYNDRVLARHWYELSAAQGIQEAQSALGRMNSENTPLSLKGFILEVKIPNQGTVQNIVLSEKVTLGGHPESSLRLYPNQKTDHYMPYVNVKCRLHWNGLIPTLNLDGIEYVKDHGSHLVDYLTDKKEFQPGIVSVKFREGTSEQKMQEILSGLGEAKLFVPRLIKNDYIVKIRKGMTVKDALRSLVDLPEVEYCEPDYIGHLNMLK